jgi:murein DD-endopeptidase MepM/ murein hydrolase activator NlpD
MKNRRRFLRIIKWLCIVSLIIATALLILIHYTTSVTKNLDSYVYELPFKKGAECKVEQGYGGLFSHVHTAALDFGMPVGTPIYAAREGTVYAYRDNSDEGGLSAKYKNKANYIIIKHDDGSFGCYWHLQKNGVLVKSGHVSKGQQIGLSGATGFVFRPHLHFSVKLRLNYEMNSFIQTKFRTTKGILILQNRETYQRPLD